MQREEKQRYLRQHVLDKDYDAQEFMDFCESTKGSVDIDAWSLAQLKIIVQSFISSNARTVKPSAFDYQSTSNIPTPTIDWNSAFNLQNFDTTSTPNLSSGLQLNGADFDFLLGLTPAPVPNKTVDSKEHLNKIPPVHHSQIKAQFIQQNATKYISNNIALSPLDQNNNMKHFNERVKCRMFSKQVKLKSQYQVIVSGHQVVNPNIFIPKYVLYSINTSPMNIQVQRRMKDFELLRSVLQKIFPTTQIPHLQRFNRLSQADNLVIKKQKLFIQSFLNSLLMNKNIRCVVIDDFLLCPNLQELKKNFAKYQKLQRPKAIQQLFTLTGTIESSFKTANRKYINQQLSFLQYFQPNLLKLKSLYDQLGLNISNSVKILQQITQTYTNAKEYMGTLNKQSNEQHKNIAFEGTLQSFQNLHKQWCNALRAQQKVLQTEIKHLYKYELMNINTIKDVNKQAMDVISAFEKRCSKEGEDTKEKYEDKRPAQSRASVDSPSKYFVVLKYQSGYYQQNCAAENKRYIMELDDKLKRRMKIFSMLQLNISNELDRAWMQYQSQVK